MTSNINVRPITMKDGFLVKLINKQIHVRKTVISLCYAHEYSVLSSLGLGSKNETFVRVT